MLIAGQDQVDVIPGQQVGVFRTLTQAVHEQLRQACAKLSSVAMGEGHRQPFGRRHAGQCVMHASIGGSDRRGKRSGGRRLV